MNIKYLLTLLIVTILYGCATKHHSMQALPRCSYPNISPSDTITLSYFDNVLEKSQNRRAASWAKRKGYHFLGVKLLNNTDEIIRGFQLKFYQGDSKINTVSNKWAARKVRQRLNSTPFICFFTGLFEALIFRSINSDEDNYEDTLWADDDKLAAPISATIYEADKETRKRANKDLIRELESYEIFRKTLYPGKPAYGIVVVKSKQLPQNLRIKVLKMDEF